MNSIVVSRFTRNVRELEISAFSSISLLHRVACSSLVAGQPISLTAHHHHQQHSRTHFSISTTPSFHTSQRGQRALRCYLHTSTATLTATATSSTSTSTGTGTGVVGFSSAHLFSGAGGGYPVAASGCGGDGEGSCQRGKGSRARASEQGKAIEETEIEQILRSWDPSTPVSDAVTLPSSFYTSRSIFKLEQQLLASQWMYGCHISQLPQIGSFLSLSFGSYHYLLVRTSEQEIECLWNVCRHHAFELEKPFTSGVRSHFTCGYHGWQYQLNGKLMKAMKMKGTNQFKAKDMGLHRIQTKQIGAIVWIKLQPSSSSSSSSASSSTETEADKEDLSHLQAVDTLLAPTGNASFEFVHSRKYRLKCNWKVWNDNYLDGGLHVPIAHQALTQELNMDNYLTTVHPRYSVQTCDSPNDISHVSNTTSVEKSRVSGRAIYIHTHPTIMFNRYGPWLDTNLVIPVSESECDVICDYYLDPSYPIPGQGEKEERKKNYITASLAASHVVQEEDMYLCESVQRGLESVIYDSGRYAAKVEHAMHDFHVQLVNDLRHLHEKNKTRLS